MNTQTNVPDSDSEIPEKKSSMQDVLSGVSDADLELQEQTVTLRTGEKLELREMTLRQRDRLGKIISSLGDSDLQKALAPLSNNADDGEDVNIDAVSFIRVITGKVGDGSLTGILCAAIDSKANRHLWADSDVEEWVLDTVSLTDELALLRAFVSVNDIASYVGNLLALTPLQSLKTK